MPLRHLLLALLLMVVWGSNFVVVKTTLHQLPPLLMAALRFALAAFPAVLWLPRPAVDWRNVAAYGLLIGVVQFSCLYTAIQGHITPGLASLVVQTQAFFTTGLAMYFLRERVQAFQWVALCLAMCGLGVIAWHSDGNTSLLGLGLVLVAAMGWSSGTLVCKQAGGVNLLSYVVWSSVWATFPLLGLSLVFEGWPAIQEALLQAHALTWAGVAWQAWANTLFGYAVWGWLMARHPAATVAPLSLLVPVFGMASSALLLGEPLPGWKLGAAALVMAGLALNVLWPRWRARHAG